MSVIIQVCSIAGKVIEGARWEAKFTAGIQEGHHVAINIPFEDPSLNNYLLRYHSPVCMLDKGENGYSVGLSFQVKQIRHMIDLSGKNMETSSMAIINPLNRLVENVFLYLTNPSNCDAKFVHGIRGDAKVSAEH